MKNSSPTWPFAELFSWAHRKPGAERHGELGFNPGSVQPGSYYPTYPPGPGFAHGAAPPHSSAMRNSIDIQAKKHLSESATLIHVCYSSISQNISCPWGTFSATGLLGYSVINSWNSLCRDASSLAFDPGDKDQNFETQSPCYWQRNQWFCHHQFPHQHITADPWWGFIFTLWLPQLLPSQPAALGRGQGTVKALRKDLWWCVLLRSSYWSWGEKKKKTLVFGIHEAWTSSTHL